MSTKPPAPTGEFNIMEAMANLTLLEQNARSARENLIMVCECQNAAASASNLVQAGSDVLRRIQNGNQATVKAAPADVAQAMQDKHQELFDNALKNLINASKRTLRQFGQTL